MNKCSVAAHYSAFILTLDGNKLQARANIGFFIHSNFPSLKAMSCIGKRIRLGALSNTSTLHPCIARDTCAAICEHEGGVINRLL